jgi:hypothetical protein
VDIQLSRGIIRSTETSSVVSTQVRLEVMFDVNLMVLPPLCVKWFYLAISSRGNRL